MPVEDIIIRFRTEAKEFNRAMGLTLKQFRQMEKEGGGLNKSFRTMQSIGGRLATRFRLLTHGFRGFRMEMLGVMFFGMGMSKFFSGMLKPTLDLVGAFDIMNTTLAVGLLPTGLTLLNTVFLPIQEWFLGQGPLVQELVGTFIVFGVVMGKLTFLVGMFALGVGSLALVLKTMFLPFLIGVGLFILIAALVVGLIFLWKNWEKISLKIKLALAVVAIALGALLLFLGLSVGWIFLIVAAIIGLIAIIKNWGKITDWIKERWRTLIKGTIFGNIVIAIIDMVKKTKSAWKGFFDWIMERWDKIKNIVSAVISPIKTITGGIVRKITGSRQFGGFIPTEGLYRLHAGETVIPANQSLTFAPTINISTTGGVDTERLKSDLNEMWAKQLANVARR